MANQFFKNTISLLIVLIMIFSSLTPAWAESPDFNLYHTAPEQPSHDSKISDEVRAVLEHDDAVEVLIYLDQVLDAKHFSEQAREKYRDSLSGYQMSIQIRRDLVAALQETAQSSQARVIDILSAAETVDHYEAFYAANVVFAKAPWSVIEQIADLSEVRRIEKNQIRTMIDPVEPEVVEPQEDLLWHLKMVKADQVWGLGFNGSGTVVGMIDSGIDWTHPALKTAWRGYDPNGEHEPSGNWLDTVAGANMPVDSASHGTHVMGSMVGRDLETGYTTGVAPGAQWIAARVFNSEGNTTDAQLLQAGQWMLAPNNNPDLAPDVVNNSWGGGNLRDDWYLQVVQNWIVADIFPVFAAGNQRTGEPVPGPGSISNPSHYAESFAVGAIDNNKIRPSWSKRGPSAYGDETTVGWKPDISAPGVSIMSTLPGGGYGLNSGTSMAAPHVSGVIALMRSADASLPVSELIQTLYDTAEPLTDTLPTAQTSPNHDYGYGLIDAFEAVSLFAGETGYFQGKVLRSGEDTGEAIIDHEQLIFTTYKSAPVGVLARVTDDVSVLDVRLRIKPAPEADWITLQMEQQTGDHQGGEYYAQILPEYMQGDEIRYQIEATDYTGAVSATPEYTIAISWGIVPGSYVESFESGGPGWRLENPWEIGAPVLDSEPHPIAGEKVLATALGGEYGNSLEVMAISPPIDMRQTSEASLRFFHWYQFGTSLNPTDYGELYLSNDGGETLDLIKTYDQNSEDWQSEVIDLSSYANSPTPVQAFFKLVSNSFTGYLGWYIDQVEIQGPDSDAPEVPQNLRTSGTLDGVLVEWNRSLEPDLKEYILYRSDVREETGSEIARLSETSYEDQSVEQGVTYFYSIQASDMFGNTSPLSEPVAGRRMDTTTVFIYDFEMSDGGFTPGVDPGSSGNDWEWGSVGETHGPGGTYDGSAKLWATGLNKNYGSMRRAWLEMPSFTVPSEGQQLLRFDHWYHFERLGETGTKYDYAQILLNVAGSEEWINITPTQPGTTDTDRIGGPRAIGDAAWEKLTISLNDYRGQDVTIRFYYFSNSSGIRAGWFIDNIKLLTISEGVSADTVLAGDDQTNEFVSQPEETTESGVPIQGATVTLVETGITVRTDPRTGDYSIRHRVSPPDQTWTLKAEAYGFKPSFFDSSLLEDQTINHTFILEPEDTGTIEGKVFDHITGHPVSGASIRILEDPRIEPAVSDAEGNYSFSQVYVGDYTLFVLVDGFVTTRVPVTLAADQVKRVDIPMNRFTGTLGDLIYDDGRPENALVLNNAGNGLGVRFTPAKYGKLVSANVLFWDSSFPNPGGTETGFGVFTQTESGRWEQWGETIIRDDVVRGGWITLDLSPLNFYTGDDFIITTIQTKIGDLSPAVGIDNNSSGSRSYMYSDGSFSTLSSAGVSGAVMMRASMLYAPEAPIITHPESISYIKTSSVRVEGTVQAPGDVKLFLNDELIRTISSSDLIDNQFSSSLTLSQTENHIHVTQIRDGYETLPSNEVVVIRDQTAPVIEVQEPLDGAKFNHRLIEVSGVITEEYLEHLMVNQVRATVDEEGSFTAAISLEEGENQINLMATDKAGNTADEQLIVYLNTGEGLVLTGLQPQEDVTLRAGENVRLAFEAPEGGRATYQILLPTAQDNTAMATAMVETVPGQYEAIWQAPAELIINRAQVEFTFVDSFGNHAQAIAPGTISVVPEEVDPPEPIVLSNLQPQQDKTLSAGDTLELAFDAPSGGQASYYLALLNATSEIQLMAIPMIEGPEGTYIATYTAPANTAFDRAEVHFRFLAADGREAEAVAPGRISLELEEELPPEAIVLTDIQPSEDIVLRAGETLDISFSAPSGGQASYFLSLTTAQSVESIGLAMVEGPEGTYRATYTAPENSSFEDAEIHLRYLSPEGASGEAIAPGKLTLIRDEVVPPGPIELTELKPDQDIIMKPGDEVEVSFKASAGGQASYFLTLSQTTAQERLWAIPMIEGPDGVYKATFRAQNSLFQDAQVHFHFTAEDGATGQAVAPGKITVEAEDVVIPEPIELTDMKPTEPIKLKAGEVTEVSFSAPTGGQAQYYLALPNAMAEQGTFAIPMIEEPKGTYRATYTAPYQTGFNQAKVYFEYTSGDGMRANGVASGSISVVLDEPDIPAVPTIERIEGPNRFASAVALSRKMFEQADTVVLAYGRDFPDALVGGIYAESMDAPILLGEKEVVPSMVMEEIARLGATQVKVLGGRLVQSDQVIRQLQAAGLSVERIAGDTRYTTAIEISRRARASESSHVYLVSSRNFPDGLSIAPVAAREDHPILLSDKDTINAKTLQALKDWKTETITIMGGTTVISERIAQQLRDLGYQVNREQGADRYVTNITVANKYYQESTAIIGTSGENFPDALVSTVYAAISDRPIILIDPEGLHQATVDYLTHQEVMNVTLMGGTTAIPLQVELDILRIMMK